MGLGGALVFALTAYLYAVVAWVILSWIPVSRDHALGRLEAFLDRVIAPATQQIRRVVPPLRMGGGGLDLSPLVLIIAVRWVLIPLAGRLP